jgi:hypothetical protein
MPVRANGYYSDPALDEGFNNLAKAFATPSGTDVAGYANAAATKEKAARLATLFANPNGADFDRQNIAVGNYAPTSSFQAQNQNDATARRGQDSTAATATRVADINNAGSLARQYAAPVILSEGQTANLPAQTVAATGLQPTLSGAFKTDPGQTITKPDGSVISGATKPLTQDEVKAAILGTLPDNEKRALVMAPADVAAVEGEDGTVNNVFKADSVGKTPYEKETLQPQLGNYKAPDGSTGTARFDKDAKVWKDTQTGATLPTGMQIVAQPATQVNIDSKAPNALEGEFGKAVVETELKPVLEAGASANLRRNTISIMEDANNRGGDDITSGPLGPAMLRLKEGAGGLFGTTMKGVPEAEVLNNAGFLLATEGAKAISSRPTQFEFGQQLQVKPGIQVSKEGRAALLNIAKQRTYDDEELSRLAHVEGSRQDWATTRSKYYNEHPIMSPFEPGRKLDKSDVDRINATMSDPSGSAAAPAASPVAPSDPAAVEAEMRRRGLLK